jgi:hypothetical protein
VRQFIRFGEKKMKGRMSKIIFVLSMSLIMLLPRISWAQAIEEKPTALAMVGDLAIARPFLAVMTVLGTATYIVSLPFTLAGGNSAEAAETLVVGPARATFVRCLGCTKTGRKEKVILQGDKD